MHLKISVILLNTNAIHDTKLNQPHINMEAIIRKITASMMIELFFLHFMAVLSGNARAIIRSSVITQRSQPVYDTIVFLKYIHILHHMLLLAAKCRLECVNTPSQSSQV